MKTIKKIVQVFFFFYFLFNYTYSHSQIIDPVNWNCEVKVIDKKNVKLIFNVELEEGWHLYTTKSEIGGGEPLKLSFENLENNYKLNGDIVELNTQSEFSDIFEVTEIFFSTNGTIEQSVILENDNLETIQVAINYQVCKDACIQDLKLFEFNLKNRSVKIVSQFSQDKAKIKKVEENINSKPRRFFLLELVFIVLLLITYSFNCFSDKRNIFKLFVFVAINALVIFLNFKLQVSLVFVIITIIIVTFILIFHIILLIKYNKKVLDKGDAFFIGGIVIIMTVSNSIYETGRFGWLESFYYFVPLVFSTILGKFLSSKKYILDKRTQVIITVFLYIVLLLYILKLLNIFMPNMSLDNKQIINSLLIVSLLFAVSIVLNFVKLVNTDENRVRVSELFLALILLIFAIYLLPSLWGAPVTKFNFLLN
ncbi:hypothetical protein H1R17_09840 [Flavobacterium sp. xlx-214]|uniref:protein-disulfide reductase DsbD domain-containing protein n=1 Tax=unclassified Flavobacterium TaxID=196869 RepID=UPI0013D1C707|nr:MULTISPECIES: protein-disulfide reductase DsbD domain-containing protein [unclassified Flavobacterium]MBA5793460.1 hypothetical protein [Flavobacterium sp. xlx-221]QMI82768.1 hypothetical protein H1R17_09840 [Flavobacterium sp. xlx-214]